MSKPGITKYFRTSNFLMSEFLHSNIAGEKYPGGKLKYPKINNEQQNPSESILCCLADLIVTILQPLRIIMGIAIHISSGFRCPELNVLVHGSTRSQHKRGEAADISCESEENTKKLFHLIRKEFIYDQVIYYRQKQFVHVSYTTRRKNRKKAMVYDNGKYIPFKEGII